MCDDGLQRVAGSNQRLEAAATLEAADSFDHTWFDWKEPIALGTGKLPHLRQNGVTYFVTFRTADSIPAPKWKTWVEERESWLAKNPKPHSDDQKKEYYAKFPGQVERWLEQRYGALELERADVKEIVDAALRHFDSDRYLLEESVVAGNHVHALATPLAENVLSDILHSWKSFTGNRINKLLNKSGPFWQKEYFDHAVRSPESLQKFRRYIANHK